MSQMIVWRGLEGEVRAAGNVRLFEAAKLRRSALANYATVADALAAIQPGSSASPSEREIVIRAIVTEQQALPRALWTSMLALALRPMIERLARQVHRPVEDVLATFVETVSSYSPGGCAMVSLFWAVRRAVFRPLARERRRVADEIVFDEEEFLPTFVSGEALIDMKRFARKVVRIAPKKSETPGTYVARVNGIRNYERRDDVRRALRYARVGDLADLRDRFLHSIDA